MDLGNVTILCYIIILDIVFSDGQTYLLIKVVGNFLPKSVHLIDASDELITDGMLFKALDDTKKLFLTGPFFTPFIMFRIVVSVCKMI